MVISIMGGFFKQFTVSAIIILCITHPCSTAASTPSPSSLPAPSPAAIAASEFLKKHGYSIFASIISLTASLNSDAWNTTGTIFAPPDFAFSFAAEKFTTHRCSLLPRPSSWLLLLHTLKQTLTWNRLIRQPYDEVLHSWLENRSIFLYRGLNGETFIAADGNPVSAVKILHPDLYIGDNIVIHGVDGVLDPASVSNCVAVSPNLVIRSEIERYYLEHAVRVLRKKGFGVVAAALNDKRLNLTRFSAITVFAPSDSSFFSDTDGLNYDVLRHVVPRRLRLKDIEKITPGTAMETMVPDRRIVIRSVDSGSLTANGFAIDSLEVYHNKWVTVLGISQSLDQYKKEITVLSPATAMNSDLQGLTPSLVQSPAAPCNSIGSSPGSSALNSDLQGLNPSLVQSPAAPWNSIGSSPGSSASEYAYTPATAPTSSRELKRANSPTSSREIPSSRRHDMEAMVRVIVGERLPWDWYTKLSEKFVQSGPSHESNRPLDKKSEASSSKGDDRMDHLAGDLFFYT